MRQSLLHTSDYDFTLQMNAFVISDEIVSATQLQIRITLPTHMFIASDECILGWGRTLLTLEANVFHAGDEHFSAGLEPTEPARSSFSHTHTQLFVPTSEFQAEFMSR